MKKFVEPEVELIELDNVDMMCDSDDERCKYNCPSGYGTMCTGGHKLNGEG